MKVKIKDQINSTDSPWEFNIKLKMLLWEFCWKLLCLWTPKPANRWRLMWLKIFGAKIYGKPFVHQRARIQMPWHITLEHKAAIGDRTNLYSLGEIYIGEGAIIAQEAYLCTGTHDFSSPALNLLTSPIRVEANVFVGARAFILPGVIIGEGAVVGASSLVTSNLPAWMVCVGFPCKPIKKREFANA